MFIRKILKKSSENFRIFCRILLTISVQISQHFQGNSKKFQGNLKKFQKNSKKMREIFGKLQTNSWNFKEI